MNFAQVLSELDEIRAEVKARPVKARAHPRALHILRLHSSEDDPPMAPFATIPVHLDTDLERGELIMEMSDGSERSFNMEGART